MYKVYNAPDYDKCYRTKSVLGKAVQECWGIRCEEGVIFKGGP